jgi:hypothetical protein
MQPQLLFGQDYQQENVAERQRMQPASAEVKALVAASLMRAFTGENRGQKAVTTDQLQESHLVN